MKVLGLVSSPRKGGNSELAVKEIMRQLPDDWEKEMIRLNQLDIKYCKACYACVQRGAACRIKDDFSFLKDHILAADKLVIAAPAYMMSGHTGLKVVMDRFLGMVAEYPDLSGKECVFIAPYGAPTRDGLVKEEMLIFAKQLSLTILDSSVMLATLPGDTVKGENLKILQRLAKTLTDSVKNDAPSGDAVECPYCTSRMVSVMPDGMWKCGICAGSGKIKVEDGVFSFDYDPDGMCNFSFERKDDHAAYLEEKKNLFLDTRKEIQAVQAKYDDLDLWVWPERSAE